MMMTLMKKDTQSLDTAAGAGSLSRSPNTVAMVVVVVVVLKLVFAERLSKRKKRRQQQRRRRCCSFAFVRCPALHTTSPKTAHRP